MPADYEKIRDENYEYYGSGFGEWGKDLLANMYAERNHFIFELLQNAEDAIGRRGQSWDGEKSVSVHLKPNRLEVSHYGDPFNESDVEGICGIGKSTKSQDLTEIGRFGIGFKSVYAFTDRPEIHSGDEHFAIESHVLPRTIDPVGEDRDATTFVLPLNSQRASLHHEEIASGLERIGVRTMLFLRNIDEVSWKVEGRDYGSYLRETRDQGDLARFVHILGSKTDIAGVEREHFEQWLVFSREVENEGRPAGSVEIAFSLSEDGKSVLPIPESKLVVFFPTREETSFGFLVQGPYRTTPSRETVPDNDEWNQLLVQETALLLSDALRWLRDKGMMNVAALRCLPLERRNVMFDSLFETTRATLKSEPLLPRHHDGYVSGDQALMGRTAAIRELFTSEQITEIQRSTRELAWLGDLVTQDTVVSEYLQNHLEIREIRPETIIPGLTRRFLMMQSDEWVQRLYEFLATQRAWMPRLASIPLIRLRDGNHVVANEDGTPQAYLPSSFETGFPTVKSTVCDSSEALRFLESLGVKTPHLVDAVVANVIPKYQNEGKTSGTEYQYDVTRILAAYTSTDSYEQRNRLVGALSRTAWVAAIPVTGGSRFFAKPGGVYLAIDELKSLFAGVEGVFFVDDAIDCLQQCEMIKLLKMCGASDGLKPLKFENRARFSRSERLEMRRPVFRDNGDVKQEKIEDVNVHALGIVLQKLETQPPTAQQRQSALIWRAIGRLNRSDFYGQYSWFHYSPRSCRFDAAFVKLLKETPWIPADNGSLRLPSEVDFEELGWLADEFLLSKIKFEISEIENVAKTIGAPPSLLRKILRQIETGELTEDEWDRRYPQKSVARDVPDNATTVDVVQRDTGEPVAFEKLFRGAMTSTPTESMRRPVIMPSGGPKTAESAAQDTRRAVREGRTGRRVTREVSRFEPSTQYKNSGARYKEMLLGDYNQRCQICGSTFQTRSGDLQTFADHVVDPSEGDGTNHFGNLMSLCGWHFALISYGQWILLDPITEEPIAGIRDGNDAGGILELLLKSEREIDNDGNEFITLPVKFWNVYPNWSADTEDVDAAIRFSIPHREYLAGLLKA